jgi:transposase
MSPTAHATEGSAAAPVLYMALELSNRSWRLAFGDGTRHRQMSVPAADLAALSAAVAKAKERFKMPASARVVSCYEAGRDGFWLHRQMVSIGIENRVVDAASIEVSRRLRHVKTDRLDGDRLLAKLVRHHAGERGGWSVVRVPSVEEEDARHLHRELERLKRERLQNPRSEAERRVVHLMRLGAIGPTSAWLLVKEFFGWRAFRNRREVAALAGLVGTPYVGVLPHGGRAGGRYRSSCRPPRLARRASHGHLRRQPADDLREVPEQEHRRINGDTRRTAKPETSATAARSTARAASSRRPKPRKCWTGRRRILPGTRARLSRAGWGL